ncbi:MAG: hypothetical protein AAGD96_10160, partial [Chloroflexota bacterium]
MQIWNFWLLAPRLNNHWTIATMISLAVLIALVGAKFWLTEQDDFFKKFSRYAFPSSLIILLATYPFAAFAKWNYAFLNPETSCAVEIFARGHEPIGLDFLTQYAGFNWLLIITGIGFESIIAILLLSGKYRRWGALLGIFFHFVVGLDLVAHYFDFSSTLFVLFLLCLPEAAINHIYQSTKNQLEDGWKLWAIGIFMALILLAPLNDSDGARILFALGRHVLWIGFGGAVLFYVVRSLFLGWGEPAVELRVLKQESYQNGPRYVALGIFAIALSMGVSPWLEVQTGYGLMMYSNMQVANGQTNHVIVPRSLSVGNGYSDLIQFTSSDSSVIQENYAESD